MRAKTMILFVIAVGCGLVASIGVSQYLENASGNSGVSAETEKIFVAVADINIGEKLDAQNVMLDEWPRDRIPQGAITELEQLEGHYPRTRLYAGEPILVPKLMDSNDGSKAVDIPQGYRVVSVKVSVESVVGGIVQPGDRVDLLVFLRKSSEVPETGTRTILRDINVFAVDAETERRVDSDGQPRAVRTISLLVKPDQAETVMLASELGQLKLSLRRPDDTTDKDSGGITIQALLGNSSETANDKRDPVKQDDGQSGFVQWLADSADSAVPRTVGPTASVEPVWKMKIMGPDGYREYHWDDPNEMPVEVEVGVDVSGRTTLTPPASSPPFDPGVDTGDTSPPPTVDAGESMDQDDTTEEDSPFDAT
ncbi:MAG: Flp pilus assembly protein CpaB [Pirellulaceae bacterium]